MYSLGRALESSGFAWVHSAVIGDGRAFIRVRPRWFTTAREGVVVFPRLCVDLLGRTQLSSGYFGFAWVHSSAHRGRRVHSPSRGFTREGLGVTRFGVGSLGRA